MATVSEIHTHAGKSTAGPAVGSGSAGTWLAFCAITLGARALLSFGNCQAIRRFLPGDAPLVSPDSSGVTFAFEVEGDVAGALAQTIGIVWEALELGGLEDCTLNSVQLVPAGEVDGEDRVPYFSGEMALTQVAIDRATVESLHPESFGTSSDPWYNEGNLGPGFSAKGITVSERDQHSISDHPAVIERMDLLENVLRDSGLTTHPQAVAFLATQVLSGLLMGDGALAGATEAAQLMGLSRQRLSQIGQEGGTPRAWARIGGNRPVWLKRDIELHLAALEPEV